jgi:glycosyltransferase involved in cell wall biosynthesis
METPLVSITCITYNHEKYIAQAIESFLMQRTNFPYEIIVGEDCSTDGTRQVVQDYCRRYPDIVKLVTSECNVGARRNGIRIRNEARGKYIAICEGDDYWTDPLKLQKQVDFLEANPDYVLCYHNVNKVDSGGALQQAGVTDNSVELHEWQDIFHLSIPPLAVVFRNCIHTYPDEFLKVFNGDAFLFGMLSGYGKMARLGFVGGDYRRHTGGVYSAVGQLENTRRSLHTRRLMLQCAVFNEAQRNEIRKEVTKWHRKYLNLYIRHRIKRFIGMS